MLDFYLGCLIVGILIALITVLFGDLLGDLIHLHHFDTTTAFGGVTVFGGAGYLLTKYTSLGLWPVLVLAVLLATAIMLMLYFLYVRPMKNSENSTGFSLQDLAGKIGEVITTVPESGYGEVMIKIGAGNTNQIAASFDREAIPTGTKVVVVEAKDDTVYVSRLDTI
ncbi:MAG TPA: NfeD family protein [Bacilli bacterium]|nr:NfeD family protein [Bacilli bacterium]